jgi:farnesyl-diphosphate farnesyltransferase
VLETSDDLRAYAYYVAGTVGHLLTDLFALHLGGERCRAERLRDLAAPFGLGLQFTNILQDLAEDRRRGWSYVPEDLARRHGTTARGLDDPRLRPAALRVIGDLVREAAGYLDRAMEYTLLLPRGAPRVRLFCLWPTFFALRTLVRVWGEDRVLAGGEKVRITRPEVRRVIGTTAAACLTNSGLAHLYASERARLERRIALRPV